MSLAFLRLHPIRWTLLAVVLMFIAVWLSISPSNDRDWSPDQAILPEISFDGDTAHIRNIRDFRYRTTTDYDVHYRDETYNLNDLTSVWYVVEPFSTWNGPAHTFLTFGFGSGEYLSISVEIRKEKDETFSAFSGMLKRYEVMYVIGDERDVIALRATKRDHTVYLYPLEIDTQDIRPLFTSMLTKAEALRTQPEFYNTLWNNCMTTIAHHINILKPGTIPLSTSVLLPAHSDTLFYNLGLIQTDLPLEKIRETFRINERAAKYLDDALFSERIRSNENSID